MHLGCAWHSTIGVMTAAGATVDNLADEEGRDDHSIAFVSPSVGKLEIIICDILPSWNRNGNWCCTVKLSRTLAKSRQFTPVVVSEHSCGDDCSKVEAAAETTTARCEAASMETPGAHSHDQHVESEEEHGNAAKFVDDTPTVTIGVTVVSFVVSATFVGNILKILSSLIPVSPKLLLLSWISNCFTIVEAWTNKVVDRIDIAAVNVHGSKDYFEVRAVI